jgi:hypothetical protein
MTRPLEITHAPSIAGVALWSLLLGLLFAADGARAQDLRITGDLDYAADLSQRELGGGAGGGLRAGAQLDLVAVTLIAEGGGSYHDFGDDTEVLRGILGGEVRVGKLLEPGLFAHVGIGRATGASELTAPTVDVGLALDLTLLPLVDLGAHVAYVTLIGGPSDEDFSYVLAGLHAALVL